MNIPKSDHNNFRKWPSDYLAFCEKYSFDKSKKERLRHFIKKRQGKHQSIDQQKQATDAVSINYSLLPPETKSSFPVFSERPLDEYKPLINQNQ